MISEEPQIIDGRIFYECNWHYTSRPSLWRNAFFSKIYEEIEQIPVMQNFEGVAMNYFFKNNMKSSFMDIGVASTFKQSERQVQGGRQYFDNVFVNKQELYNNYKSSLTKLIN